MAPPPAERTWGRDTPPPPAPPLTPRGWLRVARRGVPVVLLLCGGLALLLLMRLVERPLHGPRRPWTPVLTRTVCRMALRCLGLGHRVRGRPMRAHGASVANHSGWLDILVLNAAHEVFFVAKAEVAGWPGIGWLARATGTVFIRRDRRDAAAQTRLLESRLQAGHRLLFFPEGTSTDGRRVLPFQPTLFQSFFAPHLPESLAVQPVTVIYRAPEGADPRFYGWWGDMELGDHLLRVLATPRQGSVEVVFHAPLPVTEAGDRKALARACHMGVETALAAAIGSLPDGPQSPSTQA